MIYNDRTVRGVILARLSVMKKREKKVNLAVSKVGFGRGGSRITGATSAIRRLKSV